METPLLDPLYTESLFLEPTLRTNVPRFKNIVSGPPPSEYLSNPQQCLNNNLYSAPFFTLGLRTAWQTDLCGMLELHPKLTSESLLDQGFPTLA